MGRTVGELEVAMSAEEFGEWGAYYEQHPFGAPGDWLRTGVVASTIANVNRGKNTQPFSPADFIPSGKQEAEEETDPMAFFGKING